MSLNFAIIGVAGYIGSKHLQIIKELNHNLLLSYDRKYEKLVVDKHFPDCKILNKFSEFKKNFLTLKNKINYTVILTPNYTHFKYIKFALANGSNVICEKPLVLTMRHLRYIEDLQKKYNRFVFTILQLRTLNSIKKLKKNKKKNNFININYITPRGLKYRKTWKCNVKKSGGILFNIGIHLLDLLCYLFGDYKSYKVIKKGKFFFKAKLTFDRGKADIYLSINKKDLKKYKNKVMIKDFIINNKKINLINNTNELHKNCYKAILSKSSFGINEVKKSIQLAIDMQR
jgi:UDP-N-acetyl-2-amino-2-deoxyglucuronate dehydrogenase